MRIIDIQQILMQEPLVAFKEAELIVHPEMQKEILRQKRIQENRRQLRMVQKTTGLSPQAGVTEKTQVTFQGRSGTRSHRIDVLI